MTWAPRDHSKAFPLFLGILREQDCGGARGRGVCPPAAGWDGPTELSWDDGLVCIPRDDPSCLQWQLALSKDAGSGSASSNPAPSFVSNKNHRFQSAAWGEEGGFFQAPEPGPGASLGAGAWLGACGGEPRGTGCSPRACPAPQQGKLRHRLPSLPAWW